MATRPSRDQLRRLAKNALTDATVRLRGELTRQTPHVEWVYGHDPRAPFPPHRALDQQRLEHWEDDRLAVVGRFPPVSHYYPGDHAGCLCTYQVGYDRSFPTAAAWRASPPVTTSTGFSVRITNGRYDPTKMRLPAAYTRAATPGRAPIAVRSRPQLPDRVIHFYRDLLSAARVEAEITLSLAVAR